MKISKNHYIQGFCLAVVVLAFIRAIYPEVDKTLTLPQTSHTDSTLTLKSDTMAAMARDTLRAKSRFFRADGSEVKNRIYSVPHFGNTFPDQNDVQLEAANRFGVKPVADRKDAESRMSELVYVGSNPYYHMDKLKNSIPYLVPRAAILLQDIGQNFFDSLQIKGIPLHQVIVTSVLRSRADVEKLRGHNGNATQNSCHMYGTTFDICYNRYKTVYDPTKGERRSVRNDSLKWVLSEVLRDLREQERCLVKYEVKQGCFHITVN